LNRITKIALTIIIVVVAVLPWGLIAYDTYHNRKPHWSYDIGEKYDPGQGSGYILLNLVCQNNPGVAYAQAKFNMDFWTGKMKLVSMTTQPSTFACPPPVNPGAKVPVAPAPPPAPKK
jgi:hypothetical protein